MLNIKNLIAAYDLLRDDDGKIPVHKMNDEEIDNLLDIQGELLDQLPALVAHKKQQAMIRLKAEKEEESVEVLIKRIFARLDLGDYDCEYGKVKKSFTYKYDIEEDKLPKEYFIPNHAKIRSLVSKEEKIEGVIPTQKFLSIKIS